MQTASQAAAANFVCHTRVCQLARAGAIPGAVKHGRDWMIPDTWKHTPQPAGWKPGRLRKPKTA